MLVEPGLEPETHAVDFLRLHLVPVHKLAGHDYAPLRWRLLSCSQCQESGQRANLAPDWFVVFRQPIRSQGEILSCSQCQELGQRVNLAPDWLPENKEPIRRQVSSLSQLLT